MAQSQSASRLIAELGHKDGVDLAREVSHEKGDQVVAELSDSVFADVINPIRRDFGWNVSGVSVENQLLFFSDK